MNDLIKETYKLIVDAGPITNESLQKLGSECKIKSMDIDKYCAGSPVGRIRVISIRGQK